MQRTICGLSRRTHSLIQLYKPVGGITLAHGGTQYLRLKCYKAWKELNFSRTFSQSVAHSASQVPHDDSDLLSLCHQYGINSTLELDKESDFETLSRGHKHLVDNSPYRQDLNLWHILLDYRIRHYGSKGATNIWRGLKYGGPRVSLESEDPLTTSFWQKLLSCAAEHNDLSLTKRLCEHNGIAWDRPKLFTETISTLLDAGRDFQAGVMCDQLKSKHRNGIADVLELYSTYQPQHHDDLKAFCSIHVKTRPSKVYGQGVKHLWGRDRGNEAFILHKFLISKGDFPTSFSEIQPFMKYLARKSEDPGPFLRHLAACGAVFSGQGREVHEYESQKLLLKSDGENTGGTEMPETPWTNKVSDSFAAKAFTTKALSFEFVLNTLRAFGLREIGPQSIREIGLNAQDLKTLTKRLAKLDELGVDTGGSAYSRFIRKTCTARESALLRQALVTDMHHDVFEDTRLQQRLLIESLNKCAWNQVNLLLAMINHGECVKLNHSVKSTILELIAEDDLKSRSLLTLLSNLTGADNSLSNIVLNDLVDYIILRLQYAKRREKLSHTDYRNRAQLTAGMMQECTTMGARLTVRQWKMLIGQLGKAGALEDVHKMILWLAVWYSEQTENVALNRQSVDSNLSTLHSMFDNRFQGALVYWALRDQFYKRSGCVRHPWQTTLTLLQYLQNDCGIRIRLWIIRKTIVLFVRGLYCRSAPASKNCRADTRDFDSKKLCFKLFRSLNEYWPRSTVVANSEREVAVDYLLERRSPRANAITLAYRPTLRRALRRFPAARHFSTDSSRQ